MRTRQFLLIFQELTGKHTEITISHVKLKSKSKVRTPFGSDIATFHDSLTTRNRGALYVAPIIVSSIKYFNHVLLNCPPVRLRET